MRYVTISSFEKNAGVMRTRAADTWLQSQEGRRDTWDGDQGRAAVQSRRQLLLTGLMRLRQRLGCGFPHVSIDRRSWKLSCKFPR